MSTKRIKDLTTTAYNGSYKIAVDDETNGTKSISLSQIPDTTYSFTNGENGFTVTPSNGPAQTVTVTPYINKATSTEAGLMSSVDKEKLDGINLVVCTQAEYEVSEKTAGVFYFIKES